MKTTILQELEQSAKVLQDFINDSANIASIEEAAVLLGNTLKNGNKILSCGNGGSHCDAMHFAEELSGRYRENRKALAAIAISDPSHITCVSNDYGYDQVFSRFIEGLGQDGDTLVAISTSGNSPSIVAAVDAAYKKNMNVVYLTGSTGGQLAGKANVEIRVPHHGYADRIQEIHIKVIHILINMIENQVL